MKKQYINPTMHVVVMKMEQSLMAGSPGLGGEYGGGLTPTSRELDPYWDDEEDW
ncbi:MAG: hypothetical protein IJ527_03300 [Prevotella sp.]|nr:hypothetical protein [Prevotella sp.]